MSEVPLHISLALPTGNSSACEVGGVAARKVAKATGKRECKDPWREAGPLKHFGDEVNPDLFVVKKKLSVSLGSLTGLSRQQVYPRGGGQRPEWARLPRKPQGPYRGTSLIRNARPPRNTIGP